MNSVERMPMFPRAASSLYIHIPFCEKKCLYCDFYSIENHSLRERFLAALQDEMHMYAEYGERSEFETVFFGGGTPSLLTPRQLESVLTHLRSVFPLQENAEVTLEANPGTVDAGKLASYRQLGVNRLSIGIQSFHQDELQFLDRIHTVREAVECIEASRKAGFENISLDLIYSLPGQDPRRWEENLRQAVALEPDHISAYSLIVEDHTPLSRMVAAGKVLPNSVDTEADMFLFTMEFLRGHGFEQYEVSNYARPGRRSRHNYNYWSHVNYLGFGPSAHSFWRDRAGACGRRWWNIANVSQYCDRIAKNRPAVGSQEVVGVQELISERIFLGLRSDGVQLDALSSDFGFDLLHHQQDIIKGLIDRDLAVVEDHSLCLTSKGYLLCDEICERLIP